MPPPKVTQGQYESLSDLRYSLRLFASFSEDAAKKAGLTATQHQALLTAKGFRGPGLITIGELAERLCIRHHSAVELVDRLNGEGLVTRAADRNDRRRVGIQLTARGERILEQLSATHRDELARIGPHIESLLEHLRESALGRKMRTKARGRSLSPSIPKSRARREAPTRRRQPTPATSP